jgi:hypothetical protein
MDDRMLNPSQADLPYVLAPHVHACATTDATIFLDLQKDAYLGIGKLQGQLLRSAVEGWREIDPFNDVDTADATKRSAQGAELIASLRERGLLIETSQGGHAASVPQVRTPAKSLFDGRDPITPSITTIDIARFLSACVSALVRLRGGSLLSAVEFASYRKARFQSQQSRPSMLELATLATKYRVMRSLVFTATDACLYDSFALVQYLASYMIFPDWVIGVRSAPFQAHSWDQYEDFVLNGTVEYVRTYTPILVV